MKVTENTVALLGPLLKEHLEADIIVNLASRLQLSPEEAMRVYFSSDVSEMVESGKNGVQYLSADYLADEIISRMQ